MWDQGLKEWLQDHRLGISQDKFTWIGNRRFGRIRDQESSFHKFFGSGLKMFGTKSWHHRYDPVISSLHCHSYRPQQSVSR